MWCRTPRRRPPGARTCRAVDGCHPDVLRPRLPRPRPYGARAARGTRAAAEPAPAEPAPAVGPGLVAPQRPAALTPPRPAADGVDPRSGRRRVGAHGLAPADTRRARASLARAGRRARGAARVHGGGVRSRSARQAVGSVAARVRHVHACDDSHTVLAQRAGCSAGACRAEPAVDVPPAGRRAVGSLDATYSHLDPQAPALSSRRPAGTSRDANQVRSLLASFQSGTSRGREAADSDSTSNEVTQRGL